MDAFFASVEIRSDPRLLGLPVVVGGGPGKRGVVTAASYPARIFGIRSGMAMGQALTRCPSLISLPVNASKVVHESLAILDLLESFSKRVEPASIDEAYLYFDPVPREHWPSRAAALATEIQIQIQKIRGLTCSLGAGVNRLQAKIGSGRRKPLGITVVPPGSFYAMFKHESADIVPGIGARTFERLQNLGLTTLQDVAQANRSHLETQFGPRYARVLQDLAQGNDEGVAHFHPGGDGSKDAGPKSASHEMTFAQDVADEGYLEAAVSLLADRVARRLRRAKLFAQVAGVRYTIGRKKRTKQKRLREPTQRAQDLAAVVWPLLQSVRERRPLRLLGVCGMQLTAQGPEPTMFQEDQRRGVLIEAGDSLRDRFGEHALMPARTTWKGPASRNSRLRGWHPPEREA